MLFPFITDCATFFNNTLVLVGEIGGNDINAIIPRKNLTEVREFVPHIVQAIANMTSVCCIKFILN